MVHLVSDFRAANIAILRARRPQEGQASECQRFFENFRYLFLTGFEAKYRLSGLIGHCNALLRELKLQNIEVQSRTLREQDRRVERLQLVERNGYLAIEREPMVRRQREVRRRYHPDPADQPPLNVDRLPFIAAGIVAAIAYATLGLVAMGVAAIVTYLVVNSNLDTIRNRIAQNSIALPQEPEMVEQRVAPRRATHELYLVQKGRAAALEREEEVCPISQKPINDIPKQFLFYDEGTEQTFDIRAFFYHLIAADRYETADRRLIYINPLTRQEIDRDLFSRILDYFGLERGALTRLWRNEKNEKAQQTHQLLRARGAADLQAVDQEAKDCVSNDRVVRILIYLLGNAYRGDNYDFRMPIRSLIEEVVPVNMQRKLPRNLLLQMRTWPKGH